MGLFRIYLRRCQFICNNHWDHQHLCYCYTAQTAQFYILTVYLLNEWEGQTRKKYISQSLSAKRVRSDANRSKRHDGKAKQQQVFCDPTPSRRIISSDRDSSSFNLVGPDSLFFGFFLRMALAQGNLSEKNGVSSHAKLSIFLYVRLLCTLERTQAIATCIFLSQ